jgi:DNA sulfur modification protein DndD
MILKRIVVENFRQFRGEQSITFADGAPGSGRNVTVVFGENGRGKTGLFRALMFCLYGDQVLAQDEDTKKEELRLVNSAALADADGGKAPVYARVRVEFTHEGIPYELERGVKGYLQAGRQIEQLERVELRYQDADGNTKSTDAPTDIARIVNGILDKRVREYFLFDGEKIEDLTKASAAQRLAVAKGIRCLLDIDDLDRSIGALNKLSDYLGKELSKVSTGEYAQTVTRLNAIQSELQTKSDEINAIDAEIVLAEDEKRHYATEQAKDAEAGSLVKERERLEGEKAEFENDATDLLSQMKERVGPLSVLLAEEMVEGVYASLDDKRARGEFPAKLRKDLIESILDQHECICQRPVVPGSPAFDAILEWKNHAVDEAVEDSAMNLWRLLSGLMGRFEDLRMFLETTVQRYSNLKNSIETAHKNIESISDQLGADPRADNSKLEGLRKAVETRIIEKAAERLRLVDEVADLEQQQATLKAKRIQLEKKEIEKSELTDRVALSAATQDALTSVKKEFTGEIKARLADEASAVLQRLLDAEGRRMLRRIVVEDNYSLQVLDPWGKPFLANISAGQRQVASIAFILALARAAAGGDVLEMPLFMDTPFGKLSWQHRENLINEIPGSAAQWILLATDTELGRREAELLMRGGSWGSFHVLRALPDGSTAIDELEVDGALAMLSEIGVGE